jgi:sugar phosphate isomerase/epimerase
MNSDRQGKKNAPVPLMLQLWVVRKACQQDLAGTFKAIKQAGYDGVELYGYNGAKLEWMNQPVAALDRMLKDSGLVCCGMHLTPEALAGDELTRTIEMSRTLGSTFLIMAADEKRMAAAETIPELAEVLNQAADKLAPLNMYCGYHAHPFDFVRFSGRFAWDLLFSLTRPDVVMQMDIGNCLHGNGDPYAMLEKFPGRCASVHLKDFGGAPDFAIGEGTVDWGRVVKLLNTLHRPQWYVVEQGSADGLGLDVPRRSLEALRKML